MARVQHQILAALRMTSGDPSRPPDKRATRNLVVVGHNLNRMEFTLAEHVPDVARQRSREVHDHRD